MSMRLQQRFIPTMVSDLHSNQSNHLPVFYAMLQVALLGCTEGPYFLRIEGKVFQKLPRFFFSFAERMKGEPTSAQR